MGGIDKRRGGRKASRGKDWNENRERKRREERKIEEQKIDQKEEKSIV